MASSTSQLHKRLVVSYLLWFAGFFFAPGLHRLYNGKILTGFLWFFTFGLLWVGQFIDLFHVRGMVESHELKRLKAKYGEGVYDMLHEPPAVTQTVNQPTREQKMVKLLKAAHARSGQISVTQAVMDTGMGFEETEGLLKDMLKSGYVGVSNHPETGVVVYQFDELLV